LMKPILNDEFLILNECILSIIRMTGYDHSKFNTKNSKLVR
jgi:hypothetical protein